VDMEKQVPRPPRTVARAAEIRLRNRRREYLRRNPKYFSDLEHEFAGMCLRLRFFMKNANRARSCHVRVSCSEIPVRSRKGG